MNLLRRREFLPALAGAALAQPGPNLLRFHLEVLLDLPFSALLVLSNNDGNTVDGIRYLL